MDRKLKYFAVSYNPKAWDGKSHVTCISNYIAHKAEIDGDVSSFEILSPVFSNDKDLLSLDEMTLKIYDSLTVFLTEKLNTIHNTNYSVAFWRKSLSVNFLRYITAASDFFLTVHKNFDVSKYEFSLADADSFVIPENFEEHRDIVLNSFYGNEVFFHVYCEINNFKPDDVFVIEKPFLSPRGGGIYNSGLVDVKKISLRFRLKKLVKKIIKKIFFIETDTNWSDFFKYSINLFSKPSYIAVLGVFFERKFMKKLGIQFYNLDFSHIEYTKSIDVNREKRREFFSDKLTDLDALEVFCFRSLEFLFPKHLFEDFDSFNKSCSEIIDVLPKTSHVIGEQWISSGTHSHLIALLQNKGVIHINNEHNAIMFPYIGSFVDFVVAHTDFYYTIGWDNHSTKKIVKNASLANFSCSNADLVNYANEFLFVTGPYQVKMPVYSSFYSLCGEFYFKENIKFISLFFKSLDLEILSKMGLRPYPKNYGIPILTYDKEYLLNTYFNQMVVEDDFSIKANKLFDKYELIILDYISKSFLEVLISNKPFVVLKPIHGYTLDNEHHDFYDELITAGIIQVDPIKGAEFITKLSGKVSDWWSSFKVQEARKNFIKKNIGETNVAINNYTKLFI